MELIAFCLLVSWALVRYAATDMAAVVTGNTPPRHAERMARMRLDHEEYMARLRHRRHPTIGEAVAGRIASRIATPKPPRDRSGQGPARRFFAELWEDAWNDACERRAEHHRRAKAGVLPRQRAARVVRDAARRWATGWRRPRPAREEPVTVWASAERADHTWPGEGPRPAVEAGPAWGLARDPVGRSWPAGGVDVKEEQVEITSVDSLRRWYRSAQQTLEGWAESVATVADAAREQQVAVEQALGHLTSEQFDAATVAEASGVQEAVTLLADRAAAFREEVRQAQAAIAAALSGLGRHARMEEAVADSPASQVVHVSSFKPE